MVGPIYSIQAGASYQPRSDPTKVVGGHLWSFHHPGLAFRAILEHSKNILKKMIVFLDSHHVLSRCFHVFLLLLFFSIVDKSMDYNNYLYASTPADEQNVSVPVQEQYVVPEVASVPVQEVQVIQQQEIPSSIGNEFERLEWSTCDYDSSGRPIGFDGKTWGQYQVVKLRVVCSKLQVYGVKNARKDQIMDSIIKTYQNLKVYSTTKEVFDNNPPTSTRKEIQCPYRLMNLLFSDDFAEDFSRIGNSPSRHTLDIGKAAYDQSFWSRVATAYLTHKPEYDLLQFIEDDIFAFETTINPAKIVPHEWKKLRTIWKAVIADYKTAFDRFTQSGTHNDNFYNFCAGKKEAYYLRLHLANKPSLNEMVEANLPEACSLSSSTCTSVADSNKDENKATKKRSIDSLAEAIKENINNNNSNELAECKMSFLSSEVVRKKQLELRVEESQLRKKSRNFLSFSIYVTRLNNYD
jgi:hypothetical protein